MTSFSSLENKQRLLQFLIFTFATALIWVGFSLFQSQRDTGIPEDLQKLAEPLNPNIDANTITRIDEKKMYSNDQLQNFPVYRLVRGKDGVDRVVTSLEGIDELGSSDATPSATPTLPVGGSPSPDATASADLPDSPASPSADLQADEPDEL